MSKFIYFKKESGKVLNFCDTEKFQYNDIDASMPEDQRLYITYDDLWNNIYMKIKDYYIIPADSMTGVHTYVEPPTFIPPDPEDLL